MSSIKGYKCPHCYYYMWEGKEFYECEFQDKVRELEFELKVTKADYEASEQENAGLRSTLQEIKEFCKKEIEYFDNNDDYGQQADWIALLQIITKAEEE